MIKVLFEYPPLYWLPMALLGFGLAWWLYSKKGPWPPVVGKGLFVLRGLVFSLLAILFLGPLLRQIANNFVKPEIIFALDTSRSIAAGTDSLALVQLWGQMKALSEVLEEDGLTLRLHTLDGEDIAMGGEMPSFEATQTDLHRWLSDLESQSRLGNVKRVVLLSDGITNAGQNPAYQRYTFPISTMGLGDTIPKRDIVLSNLRHNKVSYKGSILPILAEINQNGFGNSTVQVQLSRKGQVLDVQNLRFAEGETFKSLEFRVEAEEEGLQAFELGVQPVEGEFTTSNNAKTAFIEIVESKRQILIAGPAPHPDMKALRAMLEQTESFEVTTYIHGISTWPEGINFDMAILHQLPSRRSEANEILGRLPADLPRWYIHGSLSNTEAFNRANGLLTVQVTAADPDRVFAQWDDLYDAFGFETEKQSKVESWPPVAVPFGNYRLTADAKVMLYQRLGAVETDRPLLVSGTSNNVKTAVLLGDGLWTWRLEDQRKEMKAFDELFTKLIQYLAAREDNRKFRLYAINNEFDEGEAPTFESEAYNDILERLYGYEVDIRLQNEQDSAFNFSYVPTQAASRFSIPNLPAGLYRYEGKASIQGNTETERGEFLVKKREIELNQLTANHGMLRTLADKHEGRYFHLSQWEDLSRHLEETDRSQKILTQEAYLGAQRLFWPFLLVLLLISTEWFLRKYYGSY